MVLVQELERNEQSVIDQEYFYQLIDENKPVVFSSFAKSWDAIQKWTPSYLVEKVGDKQVDVSMCTFGPMSDIFTMTFSQYIEKATKNEFVIDESTPIAKRPYLRNFGLFDECPELKNDIKSAEGMFKNDIHNLVIQGAFIGSQGSTTVLHKDTADNIVSVVSGAKFIAMIPPKDETKIQSCHQDDEISVQDIYDKKSQDTYQSRIENHPVFANVENVRYTILRAGEALYIPLGWNHYVSNLEFTVSVSCWGKKMI
ncbi:hypothetical protein CYY_001415 [Polysphondylium violaceum]|uniref:JmjC domain-containing protein n=1 Tax=Polysphondylium violaceum TaxID=133409 RepID=A0A8J4Q219_9MYCE|nr:hypothetical protein CYY_001415 [Polysphondylium violaceum]